MTGQRWGLVLCLSGAMAAQEPFTTLGDYSLAPVLAAAGRASHLTLQFTYKITDEAETADAFGIFRTTTVGPSGLSEDVSYGFEWDVAKRTDERKVVYIDALADSVWIEWPNRRVVSDASHLYGTRSWPRGLEVNHILLAIGWWPGVLDWRPRCDGRHAVDLCERMQQERWLIIPSALGGEFRLTFACGDTYGVAMVPGVSPTFAEIMVSGVKCKYSMENASSIGLGVSLPRQMILDRGAGQRASGEVSAWKRVRFELIDAHWQECPVDMQPEVRPGTLLYEGGTRGVHQLKGGGLEFMCMRVDSLSVQGLSKVEIGKIVLLFCRSLLGLALGLLAAKCVGSWRGGNRRASQVGVQHETS